MYILSEQSERDMLAELSQLGLCWRKKIFAGQQIFCAKCALLEGEGNQKKNGAMMGGYASKNSRWPLRNSLRKMTHMRGRHFWTLMGGGDSERGRDTLVDGERGRWRGGDGLCTTKPPTSAAIDMCIRRTKSKTQ